MSSAWSSKGDFDPADLDHDKHHRHYVLHTDRDSAYGSDERYPSPERRPRHHSRDASPSHRCRPASYTRDVQREDGNHRHRHHSTTRLERGRERGRESPRPARERHSADSRRGRSRSLQGVSSFLQRLGIIDDDPFAGSAIEEKYEVQRRPHRHEQHQRHHHSHHNDRDSDYTRTPPPSPSRSPTRRRAASPISDRGSIIVSRHDIRGHHDSSRGRSRDRRHGDDDNAYRHHDSRSLKSSRARSVPSRSGSHSSRSRRRSSLKRGPPSSSSTTSSNSSSHSDPSSKWESAVRNALRAGTMAALNSHGAPGSWLGNKGTRVATAALGAALVDTYMGHRHPNSINGIRHTAMRQAAEYAISSIVAEPIMERAARKKTGRTRR